MSLEAEVNAILARRGHSTFSVDSVASKAIELRHSVCDRTFSVTKADVVGRKRFLCPNCYKDLSKVTQQLEDAIAKSNFEALEDISNKGWVHSVMLRCKECGKEQNKPVRTIIGGRGCSSCAKSSMTFEELAKRVKDRNNGKYTLVKKVGRCLTISCPDHGEFQAYGTLLRGKWLCLKCRKSGTGRSTVSDEWLNAIEEHIGQEIRREYPFANFKYRADGVCFATNTMYEFDGDIFHGNPSMFAPDDRPNHFHPELTAAELYARVLAKEAYARSQGWNYVRIWEKDFKDKYFDHDTWADFFKATQPSQKEHDQRLTVGTQPVYLKSDTATYPEDRNINLQVLRRNMGGDRLHAKGDIIEIEWDGSLIPVEVEYSTTAYLEFWYSENDSQENWLYCKAI